ncbi:MAG: pitrilysin family protein, partial [bacterium]
MNQSSSRVPDTDRYETTVLESGLTVVTEALPYVHSVALGVWSRAGSRDEAEGTEGAAHFIEHMFFKGTPERSAFDIAYELERLGGYMNAFTSKDHTCFYTRILDTHVDVAMEVLGDMVQHPRLDPEELEREKSVVQEEIKTAVDTPDDWVTELFYRDLYGQHPLAHPVLGSEETVGALTREDLQSFIHRCYRPGGLLVAAAGSLEHERIVEMVERTFTDLPEGAVASRGLIAPPGRAGHILHGRDISQVHMLAGSRGLRYTDEDRFGMVVLLNVLSGGMSSRLFQSLRERRGLVYTISGNTEFFE